MPRIITTKRDLARFHAGAAGVPAMRAAAGGPGQPPTPPPSPPPLDGYREKLIKYIPAEIISLYVTVDALVRTLVHDPGQANGIYWFMLIFGLAVTPFYLWRVMHVTKTIQLIVSTAAYGVWVFALGGPFNHMAWYHNNPIWSGLVMVIFTFLAPLIDP